MSLLGIIASRHGIIKYLRNLSLTNQDCLIMTNAVLNMDIPSTGNFEYGGVFTIPTVVPSTTTGMFGRLLSGGTVSERYGFYLDAANNIVVASGTGTNMTSGNFITNFGGQTVKVSVKYDNGDVVILVNDIELKRETKVRPTTGTSSMFAGAYGNADGITPRAGRFYNGQIHSVFHGANVWGFNEPTGFGCSSDIGNYVMTGQTSNAGALTYWELNVIQLDT